MQTQKQQLAEVVEGMARGLGKRKDRRRAGRTDQRRVRQVRETEETRDAGGRGTATWGRYTQIRGWAETHGQSLRRQGFRKNFLPMLTFEMLFAENLLFLRITRLPVRDVWATRHIPIHYAALSSAPPQTPISRGAFWNLHFPVLTTETGHLIHPNSQL